MRRLLRTAEADIAVRVPGISIQVQRENAIVRAIVGIATANVFDVPPDKRIRISGRGDAETPHSCPIHATQAKDIISRKRFLSGIPSQDALQSVHESLERDTYPLSSLDSAVSYLISAESYPVRNRVNLDLLLPEYEPLIKTESPDTIQCLADRSLVCDHDHIVHISDTADLKFVLEELIEVVQEEVCEKLGKDPTDRHSLPRLADIVCAITED